VATREDSVVLVLLASHAHHLAAPVLVLHHLVLLVSDARLKDLASCASEVFSSAVLQKQTQLLILCPKIRYFLLVFLELGMNLVELIGHVLLLLTQRVRFLSFSLAIRLHLVKLLLQVLRNLCLAQFLGLLLLAQLLEGLFCDRFLGQEQLQRLLVPLKRLDAEVGVEPHLLVLHLVSHGLLQLCLGLGLTLLGGGDDLLQTVDLAEQFFQLLSLIFVVSLKLLALLLCRVHLVFNLLNGAKSMRKDLHGT
jgi:hypothetical protein